MAKNLRISVPEPCHENWLQMTPADKGRHCKSCDKVVVDFSGMSDAQVIDHFKNYRGSTCGRFRAEQLNRPMPLTAGQRLFRPLKYIAASLLAIEVFSQKAQARDVIDTFSVQAIQRDSAIAVSDSVQTVNSTPPDSCAEGQLDSCGSDLSPYQRNWLVGNTQLIEIESSYPVTIECFISGNALPTVGWCVPEIVLPQYQSEKPTFGRWLQGFIPIDWLQFKGWKKLKQPVDVRVPAKEKRPPADNRPMHSRFAALVNRLRIKSYSKGKILD